MSTVGIGSKVQVNKVLVSAKGASDAIKAIYELRKAEDSRVSLAWLSQKSGIPARGNLSDVMQGRRKLKAAYRARLVSALGLTGIQATYLLKLMERDFSRENIKSSELCDEVRLLKKALQIEHVESCVGISPFCFQVYCALGLYGNKALRRQLVGYFGEDRAESVNEALEILLKVGLILNSGEFVVPSTSIVAFPGDPGNSGEMAFLKQSFLGVPDAIDRFLKKEDAHFESTIISVRRDDYIKELKRFKTSLSKYQASIESGSADLLVQVSVGIHPVM